MSIQELVGKKVERRTFLKFLGATGATAATAGVLTGCDANAGRFEVKEKTIAKMASFDEKWVATSCLGCVGWCAVKVKVVDGRAVQITGNPESKVTHGQVCPRAHMGLQIMYDPDRIKGPMKRTNPQKGKGVDPGWVPISWDEAFDTIVAKLKDLREKGTPERLMLLRGRYTGVCSTILYGTFAKAYGTPHAYSHSALCDEGTKMAEYMGDGRYNYSGYDLANANYLLMFGLSPLEANRPTSRVQRMWGVMRQERDHRVKAVVIDPRMSVTAAKADEWIPINPGTDGALALAIAHVILTEGLWNKTFVGDFTTPGKRFVTGQSVAGEDFQENLTSGLVKWWNGVVKDFTPETAAKETGIPVETIVRIAREFSTTQPAIAWRARGTTAWPGGAYTGYAIFALNALVGSLDVKGGITYDSSLKTAADPEIIQDEVAKVGAKKPKLDGRKTKRFPLAHVVTNNVANALLAGDPPIEMVIGWHNNWAFSAPNTERWWNALAKVPFFVHITPFISEMATMADIILPTPSYLEKWAFDTPAPGAGFSEVRIKQPVVKPMFDTMSTADITFELARRLGGTIAENFAKIGGSSEEYVKFKTASLMPWDEFKQKGVVVGPAYKFGQYEKTMATPTKKYEFVSGNLQKDLAALKWTDDDFANLGFSATGEVAYMPHYEKPRFLGDSGKYPLVLISYKVALTQEGRSQNTPWYQELAHVMYNGDGVNFAEMNPATAAKYGIKDGDDVVVASQFGQVKLKAKLFEGLHPGIVAMSYGPGHSAYGNLAKGRGANPNDITGEDYEPFSGMAAYFNTRVQVYKA